MPVSLETLLNSSAFNIQTDALGEIRIWVLGFGILSKFYEENLREKAKSDRDKILFFISLIGTYLNPENERMRGEPIKLNDLDGLSDDELNAFAKLFIQHHPELFPDAPSKKVAKKSVEGAFSSVAIPIRDGEELYAYLVRLLHEYQNRNAAKLVASLQGFSKGYIDKLNENTLLSNSLKEGLGNLKIPAVQIDRVLPPLPVLRNPLHRIDEVADTLNALAELNKQSVELVTNLNDLGREMGSEFQKNAKSTQKYTYIALTIAVISLVASVVFSALNYYESKNATNRLSELTNSLVKRSDDLQNEQKTLADNKLLQIQSLLAEQSQILLDLQYSRQNSAKSALLTKKLSDLNERIQHEIKSTK